MQGKVELTLEEWRLIARLLERERGELPAEIRRSKAMDVRDSLRRQLRFVEQLLAKVRRRVQANAA